jgi:hypothetical protein
MFTYIDIVLLLHLKKDFLIVKELREKSGWGWDATRHVATAPDSTWDELIQVCLSKRIPLPPNTDI